MILEKLYAICLNTLRCILPVLFACSLAGCKGLADTVTTPIFSMGFDDADAIEVLAPVVGTENLAIVSDPTEPANRALRIKIVAGGHYGCGIDIRLTDHIEREPSRLYLRYRLWLDSSWAPETSGKLPGFGGTYSRAGWGGRPSDGHNGWSARGMFGRLDTQGRSPVGSYIYHADMVSSGQQYGNSEWWDVLLDRERWYVIEQEIQLDAVDDTGGLADGWIRAWVDGNLVFHRRNLHARDTEDLRIETVWLNIYYGGKTPAHTSMTLLIDDLWVGLQRPGDGRNHARKD